MKTRASVGAAWTAMLLCSAAPAFADTESITLDYQVAAGCAGRRDFVSRVHTFTSKADIVDDDGSSRRKFAVRVQRANGGANGDLTIDDHGTKTTRHVSGGTCDEVISALALATAIAVDPDALGGSTEPPATAEPPKSPEPPKPPEPPPAPQRAKPAPRALPRPARPRSFAPPVLTFALGGRAGSALAPFPQLEATAELGLTYFEPLEFYVGAAYGPKQSNRELSASDRIGWLGLGYRALHLEPFSVAVRAALEAGAVRATALDIIEPRSLQTPWLAVDVGLSAELSAPGPLFFQANLGGRAPVLLQRYVVTEDRGTPELYQVPHLGYLVGLSVGMHFL